MKIVIVGASGTMGQYLANVLEKENHEIIRASRSSEEIQVDTTSTKSIEEMFAKIGAFDALISTAGTTFVGPWKNLNDQTFRTGIEGKMQLSYQTVSVSTQSVQQ
jgi:dTDP-4-dehydrorhamnose reductase